MDDKISQNNKICYHLLPHRLISLCVSLSPDFTACFYQYQTSHNFILLIIHSILPHLYGASLLAFQKRVGGLWPIAVGKVGEVLRCYLTSKCVPLRFILMPSVCYLHSRLVLWVHCPLHHYIFDPNIPADLRCTLLVDCSSTIDRKHMFKEARFRIPYISAWLESCCRCCLLSAFTSWIVSSEFASNTGWGSTFPKTVSVCHSVADGFGDHQVGCGGNGDRMFQHNCIHDVVFSAFQTAALAPRKEAPSLIPGSQSLPPDVFLPTWLRGQPAALDITVISSLQQ